MVGRWRNSLPPFAAFLCLFALALAPAGFAGTRDYQYAKSVSTRLNPTGRTITISVPIKDGDFALGEVLIRITAEDAILVEKAGFIDRTRVLLGDAGQAAVTSLPDEDGFLTLEALQGAGTGLRFDTGLQELRLELSADQRSSQDLSLGGNPGQRVSSALATPAFAAGYLNIVAGLDQVWDNGDPFTRLGDTGTGARLELESALRIGEVVIENRAVYDNDVNTFICPEGAVCEFNHAGGLKRQSTRAIYDLPDERVRIEAGDTDALAVPLQRANEILGVSVEKSSAKLAPGENVTSASGGSFRLDDASDVEVLVNGTTVQRLHLRPGNYNLRDLPLTTGANNVELAITDSSGQRRIQSFTAYYDTSLLAAGHSEWAVAGGLPSYLLDDGRVYADSGYMATGFFRYGLNDAVTVEADLQGDSRVVMGGAGATVQTQVGVFNLHGAASDGDYGAGGAADIAWSLANFRGLTAERSESLFASAEYRSTDFHTPGDFLTPASGILFPEFNYWLRLNASYSAPILEGVTATIAGRYQFADDNRQTLSSYTVTGDRYGADLVLSKPLSDIVNASLLVGYSNELYVRDPRQTTFTDPEFRVGVRVNVRADDKTHIDTRYDSLGNVASLSATRSEGSGVGRWDTSIDVYERDYEKNASANVALNYYANRAELRLSHYSDFDSVGFDRFDPNAARQQTSLRVGTAIAFAGDKVAVGTPVRNGAFAIVGPHESIADKTVTIGSDDNVRAETDILGNALVPDLPAYVPASFSVDVDDLPIGYSLGAAAFDTYAPYRAGYAIEVGSAYSVSAYGTLVGVDGQPVALLSGTAHPEADPNHKIVVFTNAEGRFGAEGLAPGRWIIDMPTEGAPTHYAIDIPAGTTGLVQTGELHPEDPS